MLALILEGVFELIEAAIRLVFNLFAGLFSFSLPDFTRRIPAAATMYTMMRALGLGLVIAIAIYQIMKYFVGPLAKTTEKPQAILLRTFFAVFLIFFAPYVLEAVYNLTGVIFLDIASADTTVDLSALTGEAVTLETVMSDSFTVIATNFASDLVTSMTGIGTVGILFGIVLGIVLIIQFLKMMLEIVERYIILALMIYSSPLAFSTFTSESTAQILKKWISMFLSQCILMILSVWGCVLFINIVTNSSVYDFNIVQSMIFAYALVKIIKRLDNYLQQLGLNPAVIGGTSLLDSIAATASGLGRVGNKLGFGGGAGAKSPGGMASVLDLKKNNGLVQGIANAIATPGSAKDKVGAFIEGSKRTGFSETGRGIRAGAKELASFATGKSEAKSFGEAAHNVHDAYKEQKTGVRFNSLKEANNARKINEAAQKTSELNQSLRDNIAANGGDPSSFAAKQEGVGASIGEMTRVAAGMEDTPNAITNSDMNDTISEAVEGMPYVAFSAMQDMADNGGGQLTGDAATSMWQNFVGEDSWKQAGMDQCEVQNSQLSVSPNTGSGNAFNWTAQVKDKNTGEVRQVSWSNMHGDCAPKTGKDGAPINNGSKCYQSAPGSVARGQSSQKTYMQVNNVSQNTSHRHSSSQVAPSNQGSSRTTAPAQTTTTTKTPAPTPTPSKAQNNTPAHPKQPIVGKKGKNAP